MEKCLVIRFCIESLIFYIFRFKRKARREARAMKDGSSSSEVDEESDNEYNGPLNSDSMVRSKSYAQYHTKSPSSSFQNQGGFGSH